MSNHRRIVGPEGAADYVHTSVRHIRGLVYRREIPYFKVGHFLRFDLDDLDAWLEANRVEVAS